MSTKPFTAYLLKLATDASEVERFRKGGLVARTSMQAAGLSDEQIEILLRGDQEQISAVVKREVPPQRTVSGATGIPIEIICIVEVEFTIDEGE